MSRKRAGEGVVSHFSRATSLMWLVLSGCGEDGGAEKASDASDASSGGASSGGASGGGGSAASTGGSPGTGGANIGTGGANTGGTTLSTGGVTGNSTGGAPTIDAGGGGAGAGGQSGSPTCTNPTYAFPMNPQDPQDGVTLSGYYIATGTWNAAGYDVSQTLYICDYDDWYVVANMDDSAGDGAVKTYPNVHQDFNSAPLISSFSTISSTFGHEAPGVGIYNFAYDIWLNGVASSGSTEIMIWTDNHNQVPSGTSIDIVTFDGETYGVHRSGSYIAFVNTRTVTSGTVNLLSFFDYVIQAGWIPATSTLGQIDYGVEIVSTDGADATFVVNAFSVTAN